MQDVKNGTANHGTVYFTYEQTAGKGQRNKQWLSNKGENIILSIVIEPKQLLVKQKFHLTILTALAVKDLFNKYSTELFKIKWTNDIYFGDRKAAGILIENVVRGNLITNSIIGIGININQTQFNPELKSPVSLKQITGKTYDVIKLAEELCVILQDRYLQLINNNTEALVSEYNQHLYKQNQLINFKKNGVLAEGRVMAVDDAGRLIIKTDTESAFEFGSIEWVIE